MEGTCDNLLNGNTERRVEIKIDRNEVQGKLRGRD